jgi:hypothetical protein
MGTMEGAVRAQSLSGEEDLRFIRNFHDVFLSIGLAMLSGGLAIATVMVLWPHAMALRNDDIAAVTRFGWIVAAAGAANAVAMWLLGEFFARGRRLFLPSIVIFLAFQLFVAAAVAGAYGASKGSGHFLENVGKVSVGTIEAAVNEWTLISSLAAALAGLAFYARMKLPFAMGASGYALAAAGVAAFNMHLPQFALSPFGLNLAAGVILFLAALGFDARDPARATRQSDNAFWLHFFAAPLIIGGAIGLAIGDASPSTDVGLAALAVLAIVFAFALVSLLINRRALLVAGMIYAILATGVLLSRAGVSGGWLAASTLLIVGASMVLLGSGWHALRRVLVAPFPKRGFIARIIPPEPEKGAAAVAE